MKKAVVFSAVLVLFLSAALLADGQGAGKASGKGIRGGMGMGGPRMILAMASELNLTADQMDKIKKLIDTMPAKKGEKEELKGDVDAVREEMQKDNPDQAKIDSIIDKASEKHKARIKEMLKNKAAIDAILTPEQKEILKKKMEERKKKWEEKKQQKQQQQGK